MRYRPNPLLDEAIEITNDLGDVVFIGALAVFLHTNEGRESQDLDCSIAYPITDEDLIEKGYIKYTNRKNGYGTPRKTFVVDIYRDTDINQVPVRRIIQSAKGFKIENKRRPIIVKGAGLEVLIAMKYRANREKDHEDIHILAQKKYNDINWSYLRNITSDTELSRMRVDLRTYKNTTYFF